MIFGTHESSTIRQLNDVAQNASRVALMADGHLGYIMPIGGVAAYRNVASVVGVGFDIACGNCAIQTDLMAESFTREAWTDIANAIQSRISFGIGRKNEADDAPTDHPLFADPAWDGVPGVEARASLRSKARAQLGTVGSGNHYVDVFADTFGRVWVGVHFGSRGFGHTVASGFLAIGTGAAWGERVPEREVLLDLSTPMGDAYWALMTLAGQYAYAGREWVTRKVVSMLGGHEVRMVHNHHNFAWRETHYGEDYVVVRKGATPAFPGQQGFVGGSMGDDAVVVEGVESAASRSALYSTIHGAGRIMGRMDAKKGRAARDETGKAIPGVPRDLSTKVTREMQNEWLRGKGIILRGGDVDEAPQVYRRLPDVLAAQGGTIRVTETLSPLVVVMASGREFDPYKD